MISEQGLVEILDDSLKSLAFAVETLCKVLQTREPIVSIRPREFVLVAKNDHKLIWPKRSVSNDLSSLQQHITKVSLLHKEVAIKDYYIAETCIFNYGVVAFGGFSSTPPLGLGDKISFDCIRVILSSCNYLPRNIVRAMRRIEAAANWCNDRATGIMKARTDILRQQEKWHSQLKAEETGKILENS